MVTKRPLKLVYMKASELYNNERNWRKHPKEQSDSLKAVISEVGWAGAVLVNTKDGQNRIIDGHLRKAIANTDEEIPVLVGEWTDEQEKLILATFDPIGALATTGKEELESLLNEIETDNTTIQNLLDSIATENDINLEDILSDDELEEKELDEVEKLQEKWQVKLGDIWQLGKHKVLCGDSTDTEQITRLMQGSKATLLHADPPYGMGKEKDGVVNDNLYNEKLDKFQMQWWKACWPVLENNASAYIWGNAEDLWRLWYVGGLVGYKSITFRNEIVWDKSGHGSGHGRLTEAQRMYAPSSTERCLFFMLGEQGFNNNADNYWEGWEPIRAALKVDCDKMGWGPQDIDRICGVGMYSHWFTKSQWTFIPQEHYQKLQSVANGEAFNRDYSELEHDYNELKQEFYATRVYFDNTHDTMTDVWQFGRVQGDERHGHATPKPVEMMERCIKSSTSVGMVVLAPFLGTGPELVACERLGRKCRGIELQPKYVAVTLERWSNLTGEEPKKV